MKALTNMRSATKEKTDGLMTPLDLSLDAAVEYIADDELVEVTPASIRMCKRAGWDKRK
jgi:GTP-binding protein